LPIFGFGILAYYALDAFNIKKMGRLLISVTGLIGIFLVFYVLSRLFSYDLSILYNDKINNNIGYYYIMGFFMAFFIYSQCLFSIPLIDNRITQFYGKISYSLYLLHPFVIYKIKPLYPYFQSIDGISKEFAYFICLILTLLIVTPLAYLLNKIFEERASLIMKTSLKRVLKIS
jgi:peptidoglycan/LPS O-acetylase OafA/YrhL